MMNQKRIVNKKSIKTRLKRGTGEVEESQEEVAIVNTEPEKINETDEKSDPKNDQTHDSNKSNNENNQDNSIKVNSL